MPIKYKELKIVRVFLLKSVVSIGKYCFILFLCFQFLFTKSLSLKVQEFYM